MPFEPLAGSEDAEFWTSVSETPAEPLLQVNDVSRCKSTKPTLEAKESEGGEGGEYYCFEKGKIIYRNTSIENAHFRPFTPFTLCTPPADPVERRFWELTGHLPGDAWEGEDPSPEYGMVEVQPLEWVDVMTAAEEDRAFGRKGTLSLMYPCHEGKWSWYIDPLTGKWGGHANFEQ